MKKKNLINIILITIIFIILSFFFGGEYLDFHNKEKLTQKNLENVIKNAENWEVGSIKNIENTEIFYTPYTKLIDKITKKIDNSEKKVYLEVYMFTEKRIKESIKRAYKRGVEVKILLEKNPYMSATINDKFFNELQKLGINIAWSNTKNFKLNHSKFFIIDDEAIISTGNITYSTFKLNRDFFVFLKNKKIVKNLENIFLKDFVGENFEIYDESLVLSPNYSRVKLEKLLKTSEKNVKIYMQYLKDDKINEILLKLQKRGVSVQIIINKNNLEDEEISYLAKRGIEIKFLKNIKMHTKIIIIDEKYAFIGSENFSEYSLDKNREVGILLKNKDIIKKILGIFKKDWEESLRKDGKNNSFLL